MQRIAAFALVYACACSASLAQAHYIGAYAVANHRSCGAGNLPGTIAELDKFFASPDFPDDAQKSFYWKDARVRAAEWAGDGDYAASADTASGFDGADASLISYIASHGHTEGAVYTARTGGGANNCEVKSSALRLGDQKARYLILSTCQGLKIGTGDDPRARGEDPRVTWRQANNGLNCIFGYSNNMMDADSYGENLLHELATTDETLVEAFFRASHDISYSNIPAALCFGTDDANARQRIETGRRFVDDKFGSGGSAYVFEKSQRRSGAYELTRGKPIPRSLKLATSGIKISRVAQAILGKAAQDLGLKGKLSVWRSAQGTITVDLANARLSWHREALALDREMTLKDDFVVRIASDFARAKGLIAPNSPGLVATDILNRGVSAGERNIIVAKTVVLRARVHGLTALSAADAFEITVDASGQVTSLTASLREATVPRVAEWLDTVAIDTGAHEKAALASMQKAMPDARVVVVDRRVGYASQIGDDGGPQLVAAIEFVMEAEQGGFARRYAVIHAL